MEELYHGSAADYPHLPLETRAKLQLCI